MELAKTTGGLIIHIGCGQGVPGLTAALAKNSSYIVHGLDRKADNIKAVRKNIKKQGLYGQVSAELWHGKSLPYNDNLVNLIITEDLSSVSLQEVMRVLSPKGVFCFKKAGKWQIKIKPQDKDIGEWTHFLYGPGNNAVTPDKRVASPRGIQWKAGPKRTRDHDALASMSALTTSQGRMFYIFDEGDTSLVHHPAKWKLIARDAFNGILLWKRDIIHWLSHLYYFRSGPVILPRRLVSIEDRVYVTLGFTSPVSMLDAATGKTLLEFKGSENTEEFIIHDDVLITTIGDPDYFNRNADKPSFIGHYIIKDVKPEIKKSIAGFDVKTGKKLWEKTGDNLKYLVQLSLCANGKKAFYLDNRYAYCIDLSTGKELWKDAFEKDYRLDRYYEVIIYPTDMEIRGLVESIFGADAFGEKGTEIQEQPETVD